MQSVKNVAVVSLSAGTLGEPYVRHELDLGVRRLEELGLSVRFMPHALKGTDYVREHAHVLRAELPRGRVRDRPRHAAVHAPLL